MKKAIVALEKLSELDGKKKELNQLAVKHDAKIIGVTSFPTGLIFAHPEIIVDAVKNKMHADMIISTSPEFVINELFNNNDFSKLANEDNLEVIDAYFDMSLSEIAKSVPDNLKRQLEELNNLTNAFDESLNGHKESVLFITKEEDSEKVKQYIDEVNKGRINQFSQLILAEYDEILRESIKEIVSNEKVQCIYVCDDYNSSKFDSLMKEIEEEGVEVILKNEIEMDISTYRMSMLS